MPSVLYGSFVSNAGLDEENDRIDDGPVDDAVFRLLVWVVGRIRQELCEDLF